MRIILDASEVYEPRGASYKYFHEIIPRLSKAPDTTLEVLPSPTAAIVPDLADATLRQRLPSVSWFPQGKLRSWLGTRKRALERWIWMSQGATDNAIFHSFYYTLSPSPKIPLLAMVHDLIPELFSDKFHIPLSEDFRKRKEKAVRSAELIVANSENTRRDFSQYYGIPKDRMEVVLLGVNFDFFAKPHTLEEEVALKEKYSLDRPYLLFVGGRLHHKNFPRLLEAYAHSTRLKDGLLVAAGENWTEEEKASIRNHKLHEKIRLVVRPDEEELRLLYRLSRLFVYPSLYEGFGLPTLEAMSAGVPVLAGRAGSIPEVCGEAALLCDPQQVDDIQVKTEELWEGSQRPQFIEKGLKRARELSWEETAKGTLQVYRRILDSSNK